MVKLKIAFQEAANPDSTHPDIKTLLSPRLLKTHLSYEAIPKAKNKDSIVTIFALLVIPKMLQSQAINL